MKVLLVKSKRVRSLKEYEDKLDKWGIEHERLWDQDNKPRWKDGDIDKAWLLDYCDDIYTEHGQEFDAIQFFIEPEDWKLTDNPLSVGRHYHRTYNGYEVGIVKIRKGYWKTAIHELMHTFDNIVYRYLCIHLAGVVGVEDWDEDVVHGRDPRYTEYDYDNPYWAVKLYIDQAVKRSKDAQIETWQRILIECRGILITLMKRAETMAETPELRAPVDNWENIKRGYTFGVKTYYNNFHVGLDLSIPVGTKIYAPCDGEVREFNGEQGGITAWFEPDDHDVFIRFLHLSKIVKEGKVKKGNVIALSGNTGMTTGPHLHVDVSRGNLKLSDKNNFIDPEKYFSNSV